MLTIRAFTLSLIHSSRTSVCALGSVSTSAALFTLYVLASYIYHSYFYCPGPVFWLIKVPFLIFISAWMVYFNLCVCVVCVRAAAGVMCCCRPCGMRKFTKNKIVTSFSMTMKQCVLFFAVAVNNKMDIESVAIKTQQCVVLNVALRMSLPATLKTNGPSCKVSGFKQIWIC